MSHLDQRLIDAATRQLEQRFPRSDGVAAAILLEGGSELTGVSFDTDGPVVILAPCGTCQERLFNWGDAVEVAVADPADPRGWRVFSLGDVQPPRWVRAFGRA